MAVSMNEVVLHEHLEEGQTPDPRDRFVEGVGMVLIVRDWLSLLEGLDKDRRPGRHFIRLGEVNILMQNK